MIDKLKVIAISFLFFFSGVSSYSLAEELEVVDRRGGSKTELLKYSDGSWQLLVEGRPYTIKGVAYGVVRVGDDHTSANDWMLHDFNKNGINDAAYESWVDQNKNNKKDPDEEATGDFQLLKDMGCNTIRLYHHTNVNKELLRDLYRNYGIRVILGNFLGAYTWGSGASWKEGTDYTNPAHLENMLNDVEKMVLEFKDEPYVLAWILGNENDAVGSHDNSTFQNTNASAHLKEFSHFLNKVAGLIHSLDPDRPVGVCLAYTPTLSYLNLYARELDFVGFNAYRGAFGFGSLFRTVKLDFDRPVVMTEYGVDSYDQNKKRVDQDFQALYHKGCWADMVRNSFGGTGAGNSIGGFAYNWLDSWWFCGRKDVHDIKKGAWLGPAQDGWFNDEWLGICSQGSGRNSPFLRQLKKTYFFYKKEWNDSNE